VKASAQDRCCSRHGVLKGRTADGHWLSRALLAKFDVTPSDERMTIDGKFYTSGGLTSGIDMALRVVADIAGEVIEYDPAPPFVGGTPMTSPPETAALREAARERCAKRELMVAEAAARL
jgi:cyclohexyl-isocyanide hydratase